MFTFFDKNTDITVKIVKSIIINFLLFTIKSVNFFTIIIPFFKRYPLLYEFIIENTIDSLRYLPKTFWFDILLFGDDYMSRKQDKRNLNTKIELANAFKELSKIKPMKKISITDLITYCNINRNTFYYHFEDIYDLTNWIFNEEVKTIIEDFDKNNLEAFLNKVLDYVEKNKQIFNSAYNSFGREQLKELLHPHFRIILDSIITNDIEKHNLNIDTDYKNFLIDFYSEGIASSIVNYFKGNQIRDRKTLIKYLLSLNKTIPF